MAIIRGPNRPGASGEQTHQIGGQPNVSDPYAERTVAVRPGRYDPTAAAPAQFGSGDEEKTRIVGARSPSKAESRNFLDDPVVGWLVVTDGPGKGQSLKIGYGQNSIGRATEQRIRLDFGDDQISREGHAFVTYDPKGRKFYVQNGGGSNLIYIGSNPVLVPTELTAQMELSLGNTMLRFVPFCGAGFDWQDAGQSLKS